MLNQPGVLQMVSTRFLFCISRNLFLFFLQNRLIQFYQMCFFLRRPAEHGHIQHLYCELESHTEVDIVFQV